MRTPYEKIKEAIEFLQRKYGMNQREFSRKCGIKDGSMSGWFNNPEKQDITCSQMWKVLVTFPEISAEWIMRDEPSCNMIRCEGPIIEDAKVIEEQLCLAAPEDKKPSAEELNKHLADEVEYLREQLKMSQQIISQLTGNKL